MKSRIELLLLEIKKLENEASLMKKRQEEYRLILSKIDETKEEFFRVSDQVEKEYADVIKVEKKFNRKYLRRNRKYLEEVYDKEKQEYFIIQSRFKALQNMLEGYKYQASILKSKLENSDIASKALLELKIKLFDLITDDDQAIEIKFNHIQEKIQQNHKKKQSVEIQQKAIKELDEMYLKLCKLLEMPRRWQHHELLNSYHHVNHKRKHWTIATLDMLQRTKQEFDQLNIIIQKLDSSLKFSYFNPRWHVINKVVSSHYSNGNWFLRDLESLVQSILSCVKQHEFVLKAIDEVLIENNKSNKELMEQRDALLNEQIKNYE